MGKNLNSINKQNKIYALFINFTLFIKKMIVSKLFGTKILSPVDSIG